MKRILDIDSFLKEAEEAFIQSLDTDDKIKVKHKKNDHPLTEWIKQSIEKVLEDSQEIKKINLRTNKKLNKQEVYTLKKNALDFVTQRIFNKVNKDYFSNSFVIKINQKNKPENFPIEIEESQIIYIYFNFYPLGLIKLSKNSSILDPVSGNNFLIEEYYQNSIRGDFISPMEKGNVSIEFPLFFGYIILNKENKKES